MVLLTIYVYTLHTLSFPCSDVCLAYFIGMFWWFHVYSIVTFRVRGLKRPERSQPYHKCKWIGVILVLDSLGVHFSKEPSMYLGVSGSTSSLSLGSSNQWWHTSWQYLGHWLMFGTHFGDKTSTGITDLWGSWTIIVVASHFGQVLEFADGSLGVYVLPLWQCQACRLKDRGLHFRKNFTYLLLLSQKFHLQTLNLTTLKICSMLLLEV